MRSKIEANEYKDYILGLIFYKYLSDKEEQYLEKIECPKEEWPNCLIEEDNDMVGHLENTLGYFIPYEALFSTWLESGLDFSVDNVRTALSSFDRHICSTHKALFDGVFATLQTGLSKLGDTAASQTRALQDLIKLIVQIPMEGQQDYDVLGFIYEYLISQFAANAGKKAGEFYTPHEVSLLMSELVAHHLQGRESISIYDPTSGSGSLLINIGRSMRRHLSPNRISYYAQELKANTYNLTRMNLVMRGINPSNISTRNADTLEDDWPREERESMNPLWVDAVVSNPPYSQHWDPSNKDNDRRYADFGLAPKSKADYAFLLHDLHHLKNDGIMCIVLPHGVLFRGGEEAEIRRRLVEKGHIHAIIGLPANIFFGTGIPTIIMVLRQTRTESDILVVDASKGFVKEGKNNKLRACDIRKIVDAVTTRQSIPNFSRLVSLSEIQANEYNLNIPRYVDSSDPAEPWDIYASMFGGIPAAEMDSLSAYWSAFPGLKESISQTQTNGYYAISMQDIRRNIREHDAVLSYKRRFAQVFEPLPQLLRAELIEKMHDAGIAEKETGLSAYFLQKAESLPLVDKYAVFQLFNDAWRGISADLEMISTEGFETATRQVDKHMVIKKKDGKEIEVQEGWIGHIIPFALVEQNLLGDDLNNLTRIQDELNAVESEIAAIIEELDPDEYKELLNEDNDDFVVAELKKVVARIIADTSSPVIELLKQYQELPCKAKTQFVLQHPEVGWSQMSVGKNGSYGKKVVEKYIEQLRIEILTTGDSSSPLVRASSLVERRPALKKEAKEQREKLHEKTKVTIESLTDDQIITLLEQKWISPLVSAIADIPDSILDDLCSKVKRLAEKYAVTFTDIDSDIVSTEQQLSSMLADLSGVAVDMEGIAELRKILSSN